MITLLYGLLMDLSRINSAIRCFCTKYTFALDFTCVYSYNTALIFRLNLVVLLIYSVIYNRTAYEKRYTMIIDGAIFDLDGTLLDSMGIWKTIGSDYLRRRGIEPQENLDKIFKSMSLCQSARFYQAEYGLTESTESIIEGVNSMLYSFYAGEVRAKSGAAELLCELDKRQVKMCIVTAADRCLAEAALSRLNLLSYFKKIFTCGSVGCGKDNPLIYNTARMYLKTPRNSTWVFEDSLHAVQTSKHAGYPVAGIFDPFEDCSDEVRRLSDIYIISFDEMRDILGY